MKMSRGGVLFRGLGLILVSNWTSLPPSAAATPEESAYTVGERGPHTRTWERRTVETLPDGRTIERKASYVELANGMHYLKDGQWTESREEIELVQDGAVALQGQHQVRFKPNINSSGVVHLTMPDGRVLQSHLLGLAFTDAASGTSVLIAEPKDSIGELLAPNKVIYRDAFAGPFRADVLFLYTRGGFEQFVILTTRPPSPAAYNLGEDSTLLEVWSEFVNPPEPVKRLSVLRGEEDPARRAVMVAPDLTDEFLDFGSMCMTLGVAFPLGEHPLEAPPLEATPAGKSWLQLEGRTFLIEKMEYRAIRDQLLALPQGAAIVPRRQPAAMMAANGIRRPFPAAPKAVAAADASPRFQTAQAGLPARGFVLDYTLVVPATSFCFNGDGTYYVSNSAVTLSQTSVINGGAVVKFSAHPLVNKLNFLGPIDCRTSPWHPAFLVAADDNSVGEVIAGSSGNPGTSAYAGPAIHLTAAGQTNHLHDLRFRNSLYGVRYEGSGGTLTLEHSQFQNADKAIYAGYPFAARNLLIHDCINAMILTSSSTGSLEHVTFHRVKNFNGHTNRVLLSNSLLIEVTNGVAFAGSNNATNINGSGVFQTVGGGAHYLAANSTDRNAGTTNIHPGLLAAIRQMTTYPPMVLTNHITANTNFSEAAWRDTDTPDLGYHFSPIDLVANGISISNATVTLSPGTVLGFHGSEQGLRLLQNGGLIAEGTPLNPCRFVRYNVSQEQANTNWSSSTAGPFVYTHASEATAWTARFRFTEWSTPAGGADHFLGDGSTFSGIPRATFRDSQIRGGALTAWAPELALTNCLFERVNLVVYSWASDARNCTFVGGSHSVDGTFAGPHEVADCLFDRTYFDTNAWFGTVNHHNAYVTNETRLQPAGTNDVVLTNAPAYQTNWLSRYYFPTNDGLLSTLLNAGSRLADQAGLWHFTTMTNQMRETNSVVDIGYHVIAVANGALLDFESDLLADYLEDGDGDGVADATETSWLYSDTDYDGRSDADEYNDGDNPLSHASVKLVRLNRWRFDDVNFTNDDGQGPNKNQNLGLPVASWSGSAVHVGSTSLLRYPEIGTNGRPNINCRNGTVRFWFKPDWSSTNAGGTGPQNDARLIELGGYTQSATIGHWNLGLDPDGTNILFTTHSNGVISNPWKIQHRFEAGRWQQIALAYSPSNLVLFINGQVTTNLMIGNDRPVVAATEEKVNTAAGGIYNYPPPDIRAAGFRLGNDWDEGQQAKGEFEELETFNYPLTPQQIGREFHTLPGVAMATNDFDYDGRSDFMEAYVDGKATNDPTSVAGCRLAYWRFNGSLTNLLGDALQAPLSTNGIELASGWSSNALVVTSASNSGLVYRDVETNGWANFNCRQGAVRFWFKPAWDTGGSPIHGLPLIFMGDSTTLSQGGRWELGIKQPGDRFRFATASNGVANSYSDVPYTFVSNRWYQIAFNYSPTNLELYVNGTNLFTTNSGVLNYPSPADRANGLAIGNNIARTRPIHGQFDEVETFNRQLTAAEIWRSFESFQAVDNNLNGVPDLLEDPVLPAPVPFPGYPFVITGTIEAEQFDRGGQEVAYHSNGDNTATNDYRASAMQIVTNTTDQIVTNTTYRGAGFIVDNLRSDEWLKYTLDVRVAQDYAVDVRAAGIGTGGVFHVEFATDATSAAYTNTGPLTLLTTNWTNVIRTLLPLRAGTNIMKVVMDTDSASNAVCRLNYISIYPSWVEGATGLVANTNVTLTADDSSWTVATNNAARIQAAIDSLSTNGTVTIPSGTYYLAQKLPQEGSWNAKDNTAVFVSKSNVEIRGAGRTNTVLVAHNRATTLFFLGRENEDTRFAVTNLTLSSLAVEGRPHLVATNAGGGEFTNCWEDGFIVQSGPSDLGDLVVAVGKDSTNLVRNVLVTNCLFRNAAVLQFVIPEYVRNISFRACDFVLRDTTNGAVFFRTNASPCHTNASVPFPWTGVSVFSRSPGCENLLMFDCTFNGNPSMAAVNTNSPVDAGDGIFWGQEGGNWFIGRCAITNYGLEGVHFAAGPGAVTGNEFHTLVSLGATCGLYANAYWPSPTGATNDHAFYLVGNALSGGRIGYKADQVDDTNATLISDTSVHVSGNFLELFSAPPASLPAFDGIGAAVVGGDVRQAIVSGNVMAAGGRGVWWFNGGVSSVLLKNDFGSASYQSLAYDGTNGPQHHFLILRNTFNHGCRYHLQTTWEDGRTYFFHDNVFKAGTNTVNPFITPIGAPVHFRY